MTTASAPPILLCYDRSAGARRAIETAAELFPAGAAVVLHVWSPISAIARAYGGAVDLPTYDDQALRAAAKKLAEEGARVATAVGLLATPEISEVTDKGTAHTILAAADRHDAGAIVLGARGLSKFQSFLLGSVSNAVVQNARRPVLIVPPIGQSAASGGQDLEDASMGQEQAEDA